MKTGLSKFESDSHLEDVASGFHLGRAHAKLPAHDKFSQ